MRNELRSICILAPWFVTVPPITRNVIQVQKPHGEVQSEGIEWMGRGGFTDKWLGAISTSGRQSENANSETLHTKIDWMLDICFV